jgi:hypothetical protein
MGLGGCIDGRDHHGHLIRERRRRIPVTLARQGDRHGAVEASICAADRPSALVT